MLRALGIFDNPPAPVVSMGEFMMALDTVPAMMESLRLLFLRRLSDDERMRLLHDRAYHSAVIVDQHEQRIALEKAARFVARVMLPKQQSYWFDNWAARVRVWRYKRMQREKGDKLHREIKMRQYLSFWRSWSKRPGRAVGLLARRNGMSVHVAHLSRLLSRSLAHSEQRSSEVAWC